MSISHPASAAYERPRPSRTKQIAVLQLVQSRPRPNGAAAAAALAAGLAGALGGALLLLALAGPLEWIAAGSAALIGALLAWLGLWLGLHLALRQRVLRLGRALIAAGALGTLGLVAGALALMIGFSAK